LTRKKLTGKSANLVPNIGPTTEGLDGLASPRDLETLLQLTYLQFRRRGWIPQPFQRFAVSSTRCSRIKVHRRSRAAADTFSVTMASNHVRARPFTAATVAELNPERAFDIYRDRFADASDFTFVFVGNVDTTTLKPLAERYLASLPSTHRKETWKDLGIRAPSGVVEKVVRKGTEPKAMTYIAFTGPIDYSAQHRFDLQALAEVVRIKLIETLREKMGGTYSPGVGAASTKVPVPQYAVTAYFGSSPENVEPLSRAVFAAIDSLQQSGPSQADVDKVKEELLRAHEIELRQNSYWLSTILSRDQDGEDLAAILGPYETMVRQLSPSAVQQAAKQYFNMKNYVRVVLLPEGGKATP
jgi:zinc protease